MKGFVSRGQVLHHVFGTYQNLKLSLGSKEVGFFFSLNYEMFLCSL